MSTELDRELDIFNTTFANYKEVVDKHQSLYIFVINGIVVEELMERVKKMITIIDAGSNPSKKAYLKTRLNNFIENLVAVQPKTTIDGIYYVGPTVNFYDFRKYWKDTLISFNCDSTLIEYNDFFELEWLKNLLLDRSYINVLHFRNNLLKHIHLGNTKKRIFQEKTEKKMDIEEYVALNTGKGEVCLVHGVSSFLKGVTDTEILKILSGDKRDSELLKEYEKIINKKNLQLLKVWLDKLLDPKEGHKIMIGKEIGDGIVACSIKTIFCSPERKLKLIENYSANNKMPELVVIRKYDDDEVTTRFFTDFKGAVGIKYY
jgi:hypothetical protein